MAEEKQSDGKSTTEPSIQRLEELADLLVSRNLTRLDVSQGEQKIILERKTPRSQGSSGYGAISLRQSSNNTEAQKVSAEHSEVDTTKGASVQAGTTVRTPLLGIAYRSSEPSAAPFVELGSQVEIGDVLCLIEAMKLFNEITAPVAGEVVDIMFTDGDMVEHNTPLFTII